MAFGYTGTQIFTNTNTTGLNDSVLDLALKQCKDEINLLSGVGAYTTYTDPALNTITISDVNSYIGAVITLTGAGNSQTLPTPTVTSTFHSFTVINNDTSTNSINIVGSSTVTLLAGEKVNFIWDGTTWIASEAEGIWLDDGIDVELQNSTRNIDLQAGGLKDTTATTAIHLSDASNVAFNTTNKTITGSLNELEQIRDLLKEPTGFTAPENVIVTGDGTARTVTLTGTVNAYYRGELVSAITTGYTSPAHNNDTVSYYLVYDGATISWVTLANLDFSYIMIAYTFYSTSLTERVYARDCHELLSWQAHKELHETVGTYRSSGGTLADYVLASTTPADRRPSISATVLYDEDSPTTNPLLAAGGNYTQFFLSGASTANFITTATDIFPLSGNQPYYNLFTGGNWTQALMSNNYYSAGWLIAFPVAADTTSQKYRYAFVQGQSQSLNLATIQAETTNDVNLGGLSDLTPEFVFIAKIIRRYTAANWSITQIDMLTGTRYSQVSSPQGNYLSVVTADATLSGLGTVASPLSVVQDYIVSAGLSGGQTAIGGLDASDDLRLQSSSHGTKGKVYLGSGSDFYFDETNGKLVVGMGTVTHPSIAFGDGDSGIYEDADDSLFISLTATIFYKFTQTYLQFGADGGRPGVMHETTSATNPVFNPIRDNAGTGLGSASSTSLSLICNSVEGLRINSALAHSVAGIANYETLVTGDDDIPNKKYVDDAILTIDTWNEVMHNGNSFTVLDTENLSATITQNDTTNNPAALIIANTGSGNDITLPNSSYIKNGAMVLSDSLISKNMEIASDDAFYFGDKSTDGSWRLIRNGTALEVQVRVSTVWTKKDEFTL